MVEDHQRRAVAVENQPGKAFIETIKQAIGLCFRVGKASLLGRCCDQFIRFYAASHDIILPRLIRFDY